MRILPVVDLLDGVVVRGVAGRRSVYRPIVSRLVPTPEPLAVARAFRSQLGLETLYVADLDAILHSRPNSEIYRELCRDGFTLWIDAGLRSAAAADAVLSCGAAAVIAGLETWPGPGALAELCRRIGGERAIFSLDLHEGRPLGEWSGWQTDDPAGIAAQAADAGVGTIIVLDLSCVGVGEGVGTLELCRDLRARHPHLQLVTGGGVRHVDDLHVLSKAGLDGVLVASALHDGRLTRGDLDGFHKFVVPH